MIAQNKQGQCGNSPKRVKNVGVSANRAESIGCCLKCDAQLSKCGVSFTAEVTCQECGAVNVYEDSQQPKSFREEGAAA